MGDWTNSAWKLVWDRFKLSEPLLPKVDLMHLRFIPGALGTVGRHVHGYTCLKKALKKELTIYK